MYTPDGWVLVKILGTDPHYRIFGSWRGGYADSDSWRLNSGITKCEEVDGKLEFSGYSGSVYSVHPGSYGRLGMYNEGVVMDLVNRNNSNMELIDELPENLATDFDWIIG